MNTKLSEVRKSTKYTQKQLAELTGINIRAIQQYEHGERDINKAAALTVYRLALALHCDISEILEIPDDFLK